MVSEHSRDVARRAKALYSAQLKSKLEASDPNRFVAIEPDSADYFVTGSFSTAVAAAREAHPNRISFVIRIGHEAALHLGGAAGERAN